MTKETQPLLASEEIEFIANNMESAALKGDKVIIGELDRNNIKKHLEAKGAKLGLAQTFGAPEDDAASVVRVLGKDKTVRVISDVFKRVVSLEGLQSEVPQNEMDGFLANFLDQQTGKTIPDFLIDTGTMAVEGWKVAAASELKELMQVINGVLYVVAAPDEDSSRLRQVETSVVDGLRARIVKGEEDLAKKQGREFVVPPLAGDDIDRQKLHGFPKGTMDVMLQSLGRM